MDRFFGKKKEEVSLNDTITKLDGRVDSIEVKIKKLDAELAQCRDKLARLPEGSAKSSIKQQAMRILQQKRMYENQRGMMMQQSFNMEQTNFATESIKDTVTVVQAMKSASKDMKNTIRKLDISRIEDLQDDLQDMMDDSNQVQELLSRSYATPDYVDDADLEAELEMLGTESFELEDERPSYLDELTGPGTNKISTDKVAEKEVAKLQ